MPSKNALACEAPGRTPGDFCFRELPEQAVRPAHAHQPAARTEGGRLVRLPGPDSLIGQFINARITGCTTWSLVGEVSD